MRTKHVEYLVKTQELYNELVKFYYDLYLDHLAGEQLSSQELLRALEKLTVVGRDKQEVPYLLPWKKVPLYFRRAAINAAVAAGKSYLMRNQQQRTRQFHQAVTFYKGMYQDMTESEVTLKVWNGEKWRWLRLRLSGNKIPENAQPMSPSIVIKSTGIELHIPVKELVPDGRNAKMRMEADEKICPVIFTNQDTCVICGCMTVDGKLENPNFIRGGRSYENHCKDVLDKIEKSRQASGDDGNCKANQKYWLKLKNLNDFYSHKFSREVIEYCLKHGAKILVLPEYQETYSKYVMTTVGNWSPLHLSGQIREKLKYKAWQEGILVLEVNEYHISSTCSVCGGKVKRKNLEYQCENGHRGNAYLNTVRNLGKRCLSGFGKQVK